MSTLQNRSSVLRGKAPGPEWARIWELGCVGGQGWAFGIEPPYVPQMVITASQIQWTADVTKCLLTAKERADKKILKVMKKKQVGKRHQNDKGLASELEGGADQLEWELAMSWWEGVRMGCIMGDVQRGEVRWVRSMSPWADVKGQELQWGWGQHQSWKNEAGTKAIKAWWLSPPSPLPHSTGVNTE